MDYAIHMYGEISFHDIRILTWELEETENISCCINDMVLPKSVRSVVRHCNTNNVDTSSSDEISFGVVTIPRSIFHRYPTLDAIIIGL